MNKKKIRYEIILPVCLLFTFFLVLSVSGAPLTGTPTKISVGTPAAYHWEPAISGDYIVWRDDRTGDNNIYLYDISTGVERQLTSGPGNKEKPAVSGHYVVWQEDLFSGSGYDIVLYDLDTASRISIADGPGDQTDPSVDGHIVAWQDTRNGVNADIFLYSISSGTETQVTSAEGDQIFPRVSDNIIVWENNTFWPRSVSMYDNAGNQTPFQPVFFGGEEDQMRPAIRNNYLVWSDNHIDLTYYRVYRMDVTTGEIEDITPDDNDHISPDTDGTRVVWIEYDDIYLNDTAVPESETQITFTYGATVKDNLRIFGDRIVWWESDGATDMIYLFTLGSEETCPVPDFTIQPSQSGSVPFTVTFTDTSTNPPGNPIAHWTWDFGDGSHSSLQSPVRTYEQPGNYDVVLTVDNPLCRSATEAGPGYRITAGAAPLAEISASILSGMVPLDITFTDTSLSSTSWNWSFGDGTYAETNPATHTFTSGGTFTVRLESANEWGTSTATTTIHALTGANENAYTTIDGIVVLSRFGGQFLVYNGTTLPGYVLPAPSVLISPSLSSSGWQNITFRSNDGIGFHDFGNGTLMGNLTGVMLQSTEKHPVDFSVATGSQSSVYYTMDLPSYPVGGSMNTQIWEGVLAPDLREFRNISHGSGWSHVLATAYTIKNTLTRFSPAGPATLYVSVNSSWVEDHEGRDHTFLIRIGDDGYGQVLPTRFLYRDPVTNLDYFEAESPRGLSTFGLAQLAGTGNPFQLITLTVTSHIPEPYEPPSSSDSDGPAIGTGAGAGAAAAVPVITSAATTAPSPTATADPGVSAKVYTNGNGVVSQATRLRSADGLVTVVIGEGSVARDATGAPLAEISIRALPPGSLPAVPAGPVFTFAGMAYEILPDGATFSPPFSLSFVIPQARWGQEYSVKTWDARSGTWQDLPSVFDGSTGTITAEVSHLCTFALFAQPLAAPATPAATPLPAVATPLPAAAPPPATAVSTFASMLSWVADLVVNNAVILAVVLVLVIAVYLGWQRRFPGAGQ